MSLTSIDFLHLTVSKIQPGQDLIGQGHYSKVKSRSDHHVAHLHPLTNVPTKYQLPKPYGFFPRYSPDKIFTLKVTTPRSNQGQTMTLDTYTSYPMSLPSINFYTLQFLRYSPDNIFKLKVTAARSKVKSKSHHDVAHLHPLTNVPTKYQLPTPYGFMRYRSDKLFPAARPSGHHG